MLQPGCKCRRYIHRADAVLHGHAEQSGCLRESRILLRKELLEHKTRLFRCIHGFCCDGLAAQIAAVCKIERHFLLLRLHRGVGKENIFLGKRDGILLAAEGDTHLLHRVELQKRSGNCRTGQRYLNGRAGVIRIGEDQNRRVRVEIGAFERPFCRNDAAKLFVDRALQIIRHQLIQ